jgi:hypothetical protein
VGREEERNSICRKKKKEVGGAEIAVSKDTVMLHHPDTSLYFSSSPFQLLTTFAGLDTDI